MAARLVMGLDFGTTFSGVAYADDVQPDKVRLVTSWPGWTNMSSDKVPSRISYSNEDGMITWGNKVRTTSDHKVYTGFKLDLDPLSTAIHSKDLASILRETDLNSDTSVDTTGHGRKTTLDIVSDYLTKVREVALEEIKRDIGEATLNSMQRELVITVPAVWSERARDLTRRAAVKANFQVDSMIMIAEPEAAALYTFKTLMQGASRSELQYGDCFVVCDCGGGTVDLISYKLTGIDPYTMVEVAVGSGNQCGAIFVEKAFLTWLEKYMEIPKIAKNYGSTFLNSFQSCVVAFEGADDDALGVSLPQGYKILDSKPLNIEDHILNLTKQQMCELFKESIDGTLRLIDRQIKEIYKNVLKTPKMVFVVGGFAKNRYLFRRIREHCKSQGIQTFCPADAWPAIVKGAVCRGLEDPRAALVSKRLARKNYGCLCSVNFVEGVHDEADADICKYTGDKIASRQIDWMVAKGSELPVLEPKSFRITLSAPFFEDESRLVEATLAGSYEDNPPKSFFSKGTSVICRVIADINDIPLSVFAKNSRKKGKTYYSTEVLLEATFDGLEIVWTVMCNGKEYSRVKVLYGD